MQQQRHQQQQQEPQPLHTLASAPAAPDRFVTTTLAKCLNEIGSTVSYSTVLTSYYLLGFGDHYFTHSCQPHDLSAFAAMLLCRTYAPSATSVYAVGGADAAVHIHLFDSVDTYRARHVALSTLSAVEITMAWTYERVHKNDALFVNAHHPQHATHAHKPRKELRLPQFFMHMPLRPDADTGAPDDKQYYAALVLGNFYPDRGSDLHGATLWDKMLTWEHTHPRGDLDVLAWRIINNMQERQLARQAIKANRSTRVRPPIDMMNTAGVASSDSDSDVEEFLYDSDSERIADVLMDDAPFNELRVNNTSLEDLYDTIKSNDTSSLPLSAEEATISTTAVMRQVRDDLRSVHHDDTSLDAPPNVDFRLQLSPSSAQPYVTIIPLSALTAETQQQLQAIERRLHDGAPPPYAPLVDTRGRRIRPTPAVCARLFRLCPEQSFAFFLMADTLLAEAASQNNLSLPPPQQLLMAILGKAGTGKSEVFRAFLWLAYQHDLHRMIAVTSYTWKAAVLVSSPHNRGNSTPPVRHQPTQDDARCRHVRRGNQTHDGIRVLRAGRRGQLRESVTLG
jgi:hypothetical protein